MADVNMNGGFPDFQSVVTHGGQYVQYNIFGHLFEVPPKYRPPIMPIGRGAYGIVWYVIRQSSTFSPLFLGFHPEVEEVLWFFWFLLGFVFLQLGYEFGDE